VAMQYSPRCGKRNYDAANERHGSDDDLIGFALAFRERQRLGSRRSGGLEGITQRIEGIDAHKAGAVLKGGIPPCPQHVVVRIEFFLDPHGLAVEVALRYTVNDGVVVIALIEQPIDVIS